MKGLALALVAATMAFGPVSFTSVASAQQVDGVNCQGAWKKIHRQYGRCFESNKDSQPGDSGKSVDRARSTDTQH